jgi:hypothetical protein
MELCSYNHDEICFEGNKCPLCELEKEKNAEINGKDDEITDLQRHIEELESQLSEA